MKRLLLLSHAAIYMETCKCVLKEEIKAVYGYGKVYSVPTVSRVNPLLYSDDRRRENQSNKKEDTVKFAEVYEESLAKDDNEVRYSMGNYNRSGVYQEYLYLTREYRR